MYRFDRQPDTQEGRWRLRSPARSPERSPARNPATLEVFKNLFYSIADEMGVTLRRTSFSPNIKERLDYSCAVFDARGRTIAQGEHMPCLAQGTRRSVLSVGTIAPLSWSGASRSTVHASSRRGIRWQSNCHVARRIDHGDRYSDVVRRKRTSVETSRMIHQFSLSTAYLGRTTPRRDYLTDPEGQESDSGLPHLN